MVWVKYGLLTLGRPSVRCFSTLRAWPPVCGSTLHVSHVRNCLGPVSDLPSSRITSLLEGLEFPPLPSARTKGIYAVLKNNLSLPEGLEFTPPSSARTKGDIYVPGMYTNIFFLIFPFEEIYVRLLFFTLGRSFYA